MPSTSFSHSRTKLEGKFGFVLLHQDSIGTIVRTRELANALVRKGFRVFIISPFEIDDLGFEQAIQVRLRGIVPQLLAFYSSGSGRSMFPVYRNMTQMMLPTFLRIAISSLSKEIARVARRYDLDILEGEQEIGAAATVKAARSLGIPAVASLHNIWREELGGSNALSDPLDKFLVDLEHQILSESSLVTVVSQALKERLVTHYNGGTQNIQVVPTGCRPRSSVGRRSRDHPSVIHAGQISYYDNEELLFGTTTKVKKTLGWRFFLANRGEGAIRFKERAASEGVNLDWYWYRDQSRYYDLLGRCHVGIVTSLDHPTRRYGPAMKFYDYVTSGVPVVANDIGGWTSEIRRFGLGLLAKSDPASMCESIAELATNENKAQNARQNCIKVANTIYNIDSIASEFIDQLASLI